MSSKVDDEYRSGGLDLRRIPSSKFNLYPSTSVPPTPFPTISANGRNDGAMQLASMNGHAFPARPRTAASSHSQHSQYSQHSYHPASDDTYQLHNPQKYPHWPTLRKQYSEASRLRALNNGYASPADGRRTPDTGRYTSDIDRQTPERGRYTPDRGRYTPDMDRRTPDVGRYTPDRPPPVVENFSRPRKYSIDQNNIVPKPLLQSLTFPLEASAQSKLNVSYGGTQAIRGRGFSTASSQSIMLHPPVLQDPQTLKPSISIPDYSSAGQLYSRNRNGNNSHYRSERGISRLDADALGEEEVRTSFRSAVTTNSSFVGGTDGSSILSKSSSATSFSHQEDEVNDDEGGFSVDAAIGMYEYGFEDPEPEEILDDDDGEKLELEQEENEEPQEDGEILDGASNNAPRVSNSKPQPSDFDQVMEDAEEKRRSIQIAEAMSDSLASPPSGARDTVSFFSGNVSQFMKPPMQDTPTGLSSRSEDSMDSTYNGAMDSDDDVEILREMSITKSLAISGKNPKMPHPFGEARDRYGFKKASIHISAEQYDEWNGPYTEYLIRRRKKWITLMQESKLMTDKPIRFPPRSAKVKRFVRKGIPPDWRGAAWFYYAGGPAELAKHDGLYKQLLEMRFKGALSETDEELIERDLHRTFPDNLKFKLDNPVVLGESGNRNSQRSGKESDTPKLQALRRVLQAFSILNPKIGYCQSLNFLAGLLLLFMDEEKSFWMLNIITRHLPGTHEVNLEGANVDLGVLMSSIKESMPGIWAKINGDLDGEKASKSGSGSMRLPPITLCTTAWFMSCFIGTLPIETTLRVWDSFFYEGSKTLFRIALAIFKTGEHEIKAVNDPMEIFQVVQTIPRRLIDANALLEMTFERWNGFRYLSQEEIEKRRKERRAGYAEERRVAEGGQPHHRRGFLGRRKKTALQL